jgi:hypothetical protein
LVKAFRLITLAAALAAGPRAPLGGQTPAVEPVAPRTDYLAFAHGTSLMRATGTAVPAGGAEDQALRAIDGNPTAFTLATAASADSTIEFVYELPALTTFDRFAVPNVIESASPASTFVQSVEVLGSSVSPDAGVTLLASSTLAAHPRRGEWTELTIADTRPVRWLKVRLRGGLDMRRGESALEFTELVGNGTQEMPPLLFRFRGDWGSGTNFIALRQQGAVVSGCFDTAGEISGTVSGNTLRAIGMNRTDRSRSAFVLGVSNDGTLRGVRAAGAGAFRTYIARKNAPGSLPRCAPPPARLACGATIHAVPFADDGVTLRPDPAGPLVSLAEGLRAATAATITVEAHLAPGDAAAGALQALSERRASAVVAELARLGITANRLRAAGLGAARPLATGDDEASRSINRRFEVRCQ